MGMECSEGLASTEALNSMRKVQLGRKVLPGGTPPANGCLLDYLTVGSNQPGGGRLRDLAQPFAPGLCLLGRGAKLTCAIRTCMPAASLCWCTAFGCTTASGAAVPRRNRRPQPERPTSFEAWCGIGGGWDVHFHPPPPPGGSLRSSSPCRKAPASGRQRCLFSRRRSIERSPTGSRKEHNRMPVGGNLRREAETAASRRCLWSGQIGSPAPPTPSAPRPTDCGRSQP